MVKILQYCSCDVTGAPGNEEGSGEKRVDSGPEEVDVCCKLVISLRNSQHCSVPKCFRLMSLVSNFVGALTNHPVEEET